MPFLALNPMRHLPFCNGRPLTTHAMNFIPETTAGRMEPLLPDPQVSPSQPSTDAVGSVLNRFGSHAGAFGAVLALHLAALWALTIGLRAPAVELLVPVQMIAQRADAPAPVATPTPIPAPPRPTVPKPAPVVKPKPRPVAAKPAPRPQPVAERAPSPLPATPEPSAQPVAAPVALAPSPDAAAPAPPAPAAANPAPPVVAATTRAPAPLELPSSDAQYLQNPKPRYPPISMRMGEQGTVLVQVLVSDKGVAKDVQIKTSSGFFRLDNAALEAVVRWRFVPGKRAGVAETMWFTVPITFGLQ